MDFTFGEAEVEASGLAAQVLGAPQGRIGADAGAAADAGQAADLDCSLWKELGQAGLLSLALPAELGGDGLGVQATAAVLTEVGRHAARIPALATLALGVLPVARSARRRPEAAAARRRRRRRDDPDRRDPRALAPDAVGARDHRDPCRQTGTVSGVKVGVPYAAAARWILVPASTDDRRRDRRDRRARRRRPVLSADAQLIRPAGVHAPAGGQPDPARAGRLQRRRAVPARGGGRVRGRRRSAGGSARPDHRAHTPSRAVRPAAGDVPGGGPADRRRLRGRAHAAPGHLVGVLAARHGPGRPGATSTWPPTGWPSTGRRRYGPAITCTAASAWT